MRCVPTCCSSISSSVGSCLGFTRSSVVSLCGRFSTCCTTRCVPLAAAVWTAIASALGVAFVALRSNPLARNMFIAGAVIGATAMAIAGRCGICNKTTKSHSRRRFDASNPASSGKPLVADTSHGRSPSTGADGSTSPTGEDKSA